jgi:hypothetical protein
MLVAPDWYLLSHRIPVASEAFGRWLNGAIATGLRHQRQRIRDEGLEHVVLPLQRQSLELRAVARALAPALYSTRRVVYFARHGSALLSGLGS